MRISHPFRLCALAIGSVIVVGILVGCTAPKLAMRDVEQSMADASGGPLVEFRTDGGQVDEGELLANRITLAEVVTRSLRTSAELQSALARVWVARSEAEQTRLFPNPILSVAVRFPETSGKPTIDLGLAADLVALLQRPGRISAADDRLRAAATDAVSTVLDIVSQVQERYAAVQALDDVVPILEERRRINSSLLELAQARLRAGESARLDVTIAQAQQVDLEGEIADRLLERRNARLELSRLMGQPSGKIEWQLEKLPPPPPTALPEASWVDAAVRNRPEIQLKQYELSALGAEVRLAGLSVYEGSGVGIDSERDGSWSAGPALNSPIPLFDWGQAKQSAAKARVVEARYALTKIRREVIKDVRTAFGAYESSLASLARVREKLIPLQQQRREQAEAAYKAGQTDITTLVLAEQDLQAARARLIELEQRATAASIGLERAVGGPRAAASVASDKAAVDTTTSKDAPPSTTQPATR